MNFFKNKTIVVPVDFSEPITKAIDLAFEMADESTSLHVIHVIEPTPTVISFELAIPVPLVYDEDRRNQIVEQMQQMFGSGRYARLKQHCAIGEPGSEIVKLANSVGAQMIIMPSQGRTGLARLLIGSVAERVLRLAECPVLILRGETKPDAG